MSTLGSWLNTKLSCFERPRCRDSCGHKVSKEGLPRCENPFDLASGISGMLEAKTAARLVRADNDVKNLHTGDAAPTRSVFETKDIARPWNSAAAKMAGVRGGASRVYTSDHPMLSITPASIGHAILEGTPSASRSGHARTQSAQKLPSRLTWVHSPVSRTCPLRSGSHGCAGGPGTLACSKDRMPSVNANSGDWQTSADNACASFQDPLSLCPLPFSIPTPSKASSLVDKEPNMASMSTTDSFYGSRPSTASYISRTGLSASSARSSGPMFPPIPALSSSLTPPKPNSTPAFTSGSLPSSHFSASHAATSLNSSPGFCSPLTNGLKSVRVTCTPSPAASTSVPSSAATHGPAGWPSSARHVQQVPWPQAARSTASAANLDGSATKVRGPAMPLQPQKREGVLTPLPPPSGSPRSNGQGSDLHPLSWLRGLKKDSCIWSLRHSEQLLPASRLPLLSNSQQQRERRRNPRAQRRRFLPYPDHHQQQEQRQTGAGSHGQLRRRLDDGGGWSSCSGCRCGSSCPSSAGSSRMSSSPPSSSLNNDDDSSQNEDELYHFNESRMAPAHNNSFDFFMAENMYSDIRNETEETNLGSLLDQCKMPPYEDTQHQQCLSDGGACDVGDGFDLMCDISSSHLTLEDDVEPSVASSVSVRCNVSLGPSSSFISHRSPSPLSGISHAATAGTHFDSNWPSVSDDDGDDCSLQKEEKEMTSAVKKSKESTSEASSRRQPLPDYQTMTPWTNESLRQASNTFPLPSHEIPCFLLNPNVLEGQEGSKSPKTSPPQPAPSVNRSSTAVTTTVDSQALRQPSLVSRMYASKTPFPSLAAQRLSREKRFRKTAEALQKCGLWDIAMKTGNLVKRNVELQKEIDAFRVEAMTFLKSVIRNPENKDLRLSTASTYSLTTTQNWSVEGTDGGESDTSITAAGNNKISSSSSSTTSGYTTCHTGSSIRQTSPSQK